MQGTKIAPPYMMLGLAIDNVILALESNNRVSFPDSTYRYVRTTKKPSSRQLVLRFIPNLNACLYRNSVTFRVMS